MVGIGAVAGAFLIPRVRARIGSARLVTGAMVVTAVALAVIAASSNPLVVGVALLPVGSAWIAVMSSLNSGLQLTLPNWVRARGLAYYLVVFQGAQALGGVLWGVVADATDGPRGPLPQAYGRPAVGAVPRRRRSHRFVESYLVGTWAEHVRQHENRLTGADRRFEEQARRYTVGEPEVAHLFPP
jgi:MFS family permease